jgi:Trk-type K+ transport system membrane component
VKVKTVLKVLGIVLFWEAVLMVPPLLISIYDKSYEIKAFLIALATCASTGFILSRFTFDRTEMRKREGYAAVALSWLVMSLFGALPFYLSGSIPSYIDALFETVSGFTTTGASIVPNIEIMPRGLLFWRSFTHWIGGMGVLVFTMALVPSIGGRTVFLMRAESPGPTPGKLVPKIGESAKILYIIYTIMTVILVILLILAGMPVFNSFIYAFGTAGTGGFSMRGCQMKYVPQLSGLVPVRNENYETSVENIFVAGDASGVEEASAAMVEGFLAGLCAAAKIGYKADDFDDRRKDYMNQLNNLRSGPAGSHILMGLEQIRR